MNTLLSRDNFRLSVFLRDGNRCVFCKRLAEETPEKQLYAHHIIDRRFFIEEVEKGGYFLDNGATVCDEHHMQCEATIISVEEVRRACGIKTAVIPSYAYEGEQYDKWMNIILPTGQRLKGPTFAEEPVQKMLAAGEVLHLFSRWWKHPRIHHAPWSGTLNSDDRMLPSMAHFEGREVVVTEKIDGQQQTIYSDHIHARSTEGSSHPSMNLLKAWAAGWQHHLADNQRVCGENGYARHSIVYDEANPLAHHFLGFSMWEDAYCLPWDETTENFEILGITPVPVLWRGTYDEKTIRALYDLERDRDIREGYVIRMADGFDYGQFSRSVAKYVRPDHVQTDKHWRQQKLVANSFT